MVAANVDHRLELALRKVLARVMAPGRVMVGISASQPRRLVAAPGAVTVPASQDFQVHLGKQPIGNVVTSADALRDLQDCQGPLCRPGAGCPATGHGDTPS
jgi:hypothetical protein